MKLISSTTPEKNLAELEFSVDKASFDAAVVRAYKKNVGKISIPGFRKGKAPMKMIEQFYGKGVFYEDALNDIIPDAYAEAVKEAGINPVAAPDYDVDKIDDEGVVIKAKVYVKPEVAVKNYKGIAVDRVVTPVTDEDVDREIDVVRNRNSRLVDVTDRPVQNGDNVIIDFDGYVDGKAFDGGKSEKYNLKIGSGQFIPGFEEQIIGKNIGDNFDVNVEFPKEYHAEELAGKPAVFKIVLHEIKYTELPELDDEFAKDVSEFDTFAEYKADVKAKIEERNAAAADSAMEGELIDNLIANMEAEIPEVMYVNETENLVRDTDSRFKMQGMDLATYFKYTGATLESLRAELRPQAERQVKTRLALEEIVKLENIEVSEEEINEEFQKMSDVYRMKVEEIKNYISDENLAMDLKVQKAVKLIKDNAVVTEKAPEKKEAKPKAKTAKAKAAKEEGAEEAKPAAKKKSTKAAEADGEEKPKTAKKTAAKKED